MLVHGEDRKEKEKTEAELTRQFKEHITRIEREKKEEIFETQLLRERRKNKNEAKQKSAKQCPCFYFI